MTHLRKRKTDDYLQINFSSNRCTSPVVDRLQILVWTDSLVNCSSSLKADSKEFRQALSLSQDPSKSLVSWDTT